MKIILLSDVHLLENKPVSRLDDTANTVFRKLTQVFSYARKEGVHCILQAGDLFDVSRSWSLLSRCLGYFLSNSDVPVYCVYGQHDLYMGSWESRERTILGSLDKAGLVGILGPEGVIIGESVVFGSSYGQGIPKIPASLDFCGCAILVVHRRIAVDPEWYGDVDYQDARDFLRKHSQFDLILCGDAHQAFLYQGNGRTICNAGPMLRREAVESMFKHNPQFFVYDTSVRDIVDVVPLDCESADVVLSRENYSKQVRLRLDEFVKGLDKVRLRGVGFSFMDNLLRYMEDNEIGEELRKLILEIVEGGSHGETRYSGSGDNQKITSSDRGEEGGLEPTEGRGAAVNGSAWKVRTHRFEERRKAIGRSKARSRQAGKEAQGNDCQN